MVSADYSVKKGTQLSLIKASYNNKESEKQLNLDMISLFLPNMLLWFYRVSLIEGWLFRSRVHLIETKGQFN